MKSKVKKSQENLKANPYLNTCRTASKPIKEKHQK